VTLDQRERDELCDLFLALGPDAPTLCEGWRTVDLATHLVVREREPFAAAGIMIERFAPVTQRHQDAWAAKGLEPVVQKLRRPPLFPWRVPKLRELLNLTEYVVHHEDVRRANGEGPRTDRPDLDDAMWSSLGRMGRLATRKLKGAGLELVSPSGARTTVKKGTPTATLTGGPVDLLLYLSGRKSAAQVELGGPPEAIAAVEAGEFGL
jgi:uncharacterized protein (TIGR03085 family)